MPRRAPDGMGVIEHRMTLGTFERHLLEDTVRAEKWKDYAEAANQLVLPVGILAIGTGAVLSAAAFMKWADVTMTQAWDATKRLWDGTVELVTNPIDSLFEFGEFIGHETSDVVTSIQSLLASGDKRPAYTREKQNAILNRMEQLATAWNNIQHLDKNSQLYVDNANSLTQAYQLEREVIRKQFAYKTKNFRDDKRGEIYANLKHKMINLGFFSISGSGAINATALWDEVVRTGGWGEYTT